MQELNQAAIPIANYKQTIMLDADRIVVEDATGRHEVSLRDISTVHVYPLFFPVLRLFPALVSDVYLSSGDVEVKIFNVSGATVAVIIAEVARVNLSATVDRQPLARGIGGFSGYLMRSLDRQVDPGVPHASLPAVFILLDLFWMLVLFGILWYGVMRLFF
jgi:hypothetical protein